MIKKVTDLDIQNHFGVKYTSKATSVYHDFKKKQIQNNTVLHLDCHGMTVHYAYKMTMGFIENHFTLQTKSVTIITGRSGIINREFYYWVENHSKVKQIQDLNGSWILHLQRSKTRPS